MKPGDVYFVKSQYKLLLFSSPDKIDDYASLVGTIKNDAPCMILEAQRGKAGGWKDVSVIRVASAGGLSGWSYQHRLENFLDLASKNERRTKKKP